MQQQTQRAKSRDKTRRKPAQTAKRRGKSRRPQPQKATQRRRSNRQARGATRRKSSPRNRQSKALQICALVGRYAGAHLAAAGRRIAGPFRGAAAVPRKLRALVRKKRNNQFPESDRGPVQWLLFLWGMMPRLGSALGEGLQRHRKRSAQGRARRKSAMENLHIHPAVFLLGSMATALAAVGLSLYTVGTAVRYEGRELCVVSGGAEVDSALAHVEELTRQTLAQPDYAVDRSLVETGRKLVARRDIASAETLRSTLVEEAGLLDYGYVLYVDGEPVAATPHAGALEELLEQLKIGYVTENTVECGFAETTEIRQQYVSRDYMMNLGYIAERINDTKQGEVTYTVAAGDTYYGVAEKYGLTLAELLAMNPGYNVNLLLVGDVLTVSRAVPYLTVVDVERQSEVLDVAYDIVYQDDPTMYQGDYKVLSPGERGKEDVTSNVTYINGEERGRQIVARAMLVEPTAEIQARGTKERPSWLPTGVFRWPCSGTLTSRFGYRGSPTAGATSFHKGLDIANRYGTAICASDGGTVEYSGWKSGLGYLVIINHGNGFKTYYGHNSSLLVRVGDHVYQGQVIARMGSTGISTGNHCHFGILLNGNFVNPLNYLR